MPLKVFVADDSITIQKIVSLAFSGDDVAIEAVSDGESALESLRRFCADIVLADIFMPGCSGYELCARIKEDPDLKNIPVILMVGTFEPFDELEASRVKCDGRLTKPFDTEELIQTVHRLVGIKPQIDAHSVQAAVGRGKVSTAAFQSFLGEKRILDVFSPEITSAGVPASIPPCGATAANPAPQPVTASALSEETLNVIVDKVVRKMSPDVIRDVAWEVVPELSEAIIRSTMKEQQ
jgi:CheY-like chemotaxis protein